MLALCTGPLAWAFGSYPAALALERGPQFALAAAVAAAPLITVPLRLQAVGLVAALYAAAWLAVALGHHRRFARSRRQSRAAGLRVLVVVAESPRLAAWLYRRRGIRVPDRPLACAVHVDPAWRPAYAMAPADVAREFGRQYREDYDRLLAGLCGRPVLVGSSTFNRHESVWTARAVAGGWALHGAGPLFQGAPGRNGPGARMRQQFGMFGGRVSSRPTDSPQAWRTRVFDCQAGRRYPERVGEWMLQRTIKAVVRPGEQSGWVAECFEIAVVTQGATLDELMANLQEAVELALDGEDLASLGLAPNPAILVTMELQPQHA